jgi:signal transduction histidine kinase
LLTNYLTLARGQDRQVFGVEEVVSPATRLIARQLAARKCVLEVVIPTPQPTLFGNRAELQQVVLNLLINAVHAVREGGTVRIETFSTPAGRTVVAVADDGPGVPDDLREKIFRPLFTTKPAGEGTGLGLAWSRELAQAHGGTLTLDASARSGARFVLEIPAQASAAELRSP